MRSGSGSVVERPQSAKLSSLKSGTEHHGLARLLQELGDSEPGTQMLGK